MTIEQLISKTEDEIGKKNAEKMEHVGNRPHYPMFFAANAGFNAKGWKDVHHVLERIWPQSVKNLVVCQYQTDKGTPALYSIEDSQPMQVEQIQKMLDEAKTQSYTFAEMSEWCIYNLLDTGSISTLEEFKREYSIIDELKDIVVDPAKGILILLLDNALEKRTLADEIREFLSTEDSKYDSRIILSTRDMSSVNHKPAELRRIAGDVIVISNNDAISKIDDEDFRARRETFVNGGTYTISYVNKENPNDRIALQICETLIGHLGEQMNSSARTNIKYWTDLLKIKNNRCSLCEKFIENTPLNIPNEALAGLPVKQEAIGEKIDFSTISYEKFIRYTFTDVFENFTATYFQSKLSPYIKEKDVIDQFKALIVESAPLSACKQLDEEMVEQIMNQLQPGVAVPQASLPQYFEDKMKAYLRKDILYPTMRQVLEGLKQDAEKTEEAIREVQQAFEVSRSLADDADLGRIYKDTCNAYLQKGGSKDLRNACAPGNDKEEIIAGLYTCVRNMVSQNEDLFSMPLVDSWAKRLEMAGEAIYTEILKALAENQKEHILLFSRGAVTPGIKVYMLHTTDKDGGQPTELYGHLQRAFAMDHSALFFNTGYDDSLEALNFYSIEGNNLVL